MKINLTLLFLLSFFFCNAQSWEWKKNISSQKILQDHAHNVYALTSQGVTGFTITKLDINGTILWSKTCANGILATAKFDKDSNIVILGNITVPSTLDTLTLNPKGEKSMFLAKLSPSGVGLEKSVFGSNGTTFGNDLFISANGDYLVSGEFKGSFNINGQLISSNDTVIVGFLVRLNANKNVVWYEVAGFYTGGYNSSIGEVVETTSGKYYMTVTMFAGLVDFKGYKFQSSGQYLVQLDSSRQVTWVSSLGYPGLTFDKWSDIKTAGDTVCMKVYFNHHGVSSNVHVWYPNGTLLQNYYSFPAYGLGYDIHDGKIYYAYAYRVSNAPAHNYFKFGYRSLTSINSIHEDSIPYTSYSYINDLSYIANNQYYICGSEGTGFTAKFNGGLVAGIPGNSNHIITNLYPNPTNGNLTINIDNASTSYSIILINNLGQIVYNKPHVSGGQILDLSCFKKGIYFVQIKTVKATEVKKLVLE